MNSVKGLDECVVRHAFDEVALRSGLQGLVDVFVAFVGSEDNDSRFG